MHRTTDPGPDAPMTPALQAFVDRWTASSGAERANKDSFLVELCDVLEVPRPDPVTGDPEADRYVFEKDALLPHEGGRVSTGKVDLYKHGCFILEAKQGSEAGATKLGTAKRGTAMWALAMQEALGQALGYAQTFDAPPPFVVVCDIGHCFDLYATFDGSRHYRDFPDAQRHRVFLRDLPRHVATLRAIFTEPHQLDPAKYAARITREIAGHLAELARTLDAAGHTGETIAKFLMRCIFTMFAEDVGLLPERLFTDSLEKRWIPAPASFQDEVESLWQTMNTGGKLFGVGTVKQFNGGLFAEPTALPLARPQLERLLEASRTSWNDVEPSIFGTLLERALDAKERHALGAHFTPRAYVERLVRPTIEEPLRADWDVVRAEVRQLVEAGKEQEAVASVRAFHRQLCQVRVLDPACGTGNFLYVTLDLFKRLESEVLGLLADLGESQTVLELEGATVTPAQFHGLEIKPWAKEIAELVLWIGYLQWQLRTTGDAGHIPEPVLRKYGNIECRDAVLEYDRIEPVLDDAGQPVTRWDGETTKQHPVTGKDVPDDTARVPVVRYVNPRKAEWPEAEFVVGNPPFVGTKRMRATLGDGYVEALRQTYHEDVEDNADLVMYWWNVAARKVKVGTLRRFGLITTNSITQVFNRRVVSRALNGGLRIVYAVPDHPWVEAADGAAVRIAMTVATARSQSLPRIEAILGEYPSEDGSVAVLTRSKTVDVIHADLSGNADVVAAVTLEANSRLCGLGVALHGAGFLLEEEEAKRIREQASDPAVVPLVNGRDLLQASRRRWVIDFSFLSEEDARKKSPAAFQILIDRVLPERKLNKRDSIRTLWWRFGWERPELRAAMKGCSRYIATPETAKYRVFQFLPNAVLPEHKLVVVASDDASLLGLLSSRLHTAWALAAGGQLGPTPVYSKTRCFDPFPFPDLDGEEKARIRELGEQLDAHRKRQQSLYPDLTITGMYNVLTQLRSGEPLTAKEKVIHEQGLVSILKQLHDDLDAAVFDAYGWPHDLTDEQILERLVALNAERAEEERNGLIRWLRPEYQNPSGSTTQVGMGFTAEGDEGAAEQPAEARPVGPWPKALPQRIAEVRDLLTASARSWGLDDVAAAFTGARRKDVETVLDSLASLGLLLTFEAAGGRRWRAGERGGG